MVYSLFIILHFDVLWVNLLTIPYHCISVSTRVESMANIYYICVRLRIVTRLKQCLDNLCKSFQSVTLSSMNTPVCVADNENFALKPITLR